MSNNENLAKPPRYAFDCPKCGKSLNLEEKIYKSYYEGHELCMSCRPIKDEGAEPNDNH